MKDLRMGDILVRKDDGTRWRFVRYSIDKITVSAEWASKNDWTGSSGDKSFIYVAPINEDGEPAFISENPVLASLFERD